MGGFGSGHQGTRKPLVEAYRRLQPLKLLSALRAGKQAVIHWRDGERLCLSVSDAAPQPACIDCDLYLRSEIRTSFVPLQWLETPYGHRPYLLCPRCRTRCTVIRVAGALLACRHCLSVNYASTRDRTGGVMNKLERIRARLGWPPGFAHGHGERPSRMRHRTFHRLVAEHDHLARVWNAVTLGRLERFT